MSAKVKRYRCGWCGHPTSSDGTPIPYKTLRAHTVTDWDGAEHLNGKCCPGGRYEERPVYQVTREMAMDAGDLSLEGTWSNW